MTTVRMLECQSGYNVTDGVRVPYVHNVGDIVEKDDDEAERMIAKKQAERVEPKKASRGPRPETATKPKPE